MKIYLPGRNGPATLSERLMTGVAVIAGLGLFALLLTVGLFVGIIALGVGLLAFGIAMLRQRWGTGSTPGQHSRHQAGPSSREASDSKQGPRAVIEGEFVVVDRDRQG